MHIERLEGYHFRNLERFALELQPGFVVVAGANAQGKTNLLEAMYVCATGKSFRRARPREMLRHGEKRGGLKARFLRQGVRHDVEVALESRRRTIKIDDRALRRASALLELLNVVAFFPDDLRIVKGSPEQRRHFLDRAVANHRREFVEATLRYLKALKTRNGLLRQPQVDRNVLEVYDEQLIEHGLVVHRHRHEILTELQPLAETYFARIMRTELPVRVGLRAGFGPRELEREAAALTGDHLRAGLAESYNRDRARGLTHVGPHRADLELELAEQPARRFASQGQQRAMVLALKLAEAQYLKARLDCAPFLLLDDVSSELDEERTELLFELIAELQCQVWVTTTRADLIPEPPWLPEIPGRGGRGDAHGPGRRGRSGKLLN